MLHSAIFLAVGLALIITGGDWFVGAAVRLGEYLRMPHEVIGSTPVSLVLLLYVVLTENRITRRQGVLLLGSYPVYLAVVVGMTVFRRG